MTTPTHADWERARDQRDRLARRAVQHLLDGNIESAKTCAQLWDVADNAQLRICRALDAQEGQ